MNRRIGLLAGLLLSSMWLAGFTGGGCFGSGSGDDGGSGGGSPPPAACESLDEEACLAAQGCMANYELAGAPEYDCQCAPCRPDFDCPPCDCGGSPVFVSCDPRPTDPNCPAIGCAIYCEFGQAPGPDGCPSCSCNPPPTGCAAIQDELACIDAGCIPQYGGGTPDCPPCRPDGVCPGCTGEAGFMGCADPIPQGECLSDGDCPDGFFCAWVGGGGGDCACPACEPNGPCPPCDCGGGAAPPAGGVCIPYAPGCTADVDCGPGGHCFDGGCYFDPGCASDSDCPAGTRCEYGGADPMPCDCMCDPADPNCGCACPGMPAPMGVCVPVAPQCRTDADCGGGACVNGLCQQGPMCLDDAECPNGYCDLAGSAPCPDPADPSCGGLRPAGGACVFPSCDDGTEPMCDRIPPVCAAGQTLAARNNCWECVDARSCGPTDPCFGAWLDAAGMCRGPADGVLPAECCGVVCDQVVTYAADPATGICFAFATPCDVPAGWGPCAR